MGDRVFDVALTISILFHLLILLELPQVRPRLENVPKLIYRPAGALEDARSRPVPQYQPPPARPKNNMKLSRERFEKTGIGEDFKPSSFSNQNITSTIVEEIKKADIQDPKKIDDELFKKLIEVQNVPADPKVKAYYLNYYDRIRQRIRHYAFKSYNSSMSSGDVFITFTLDYKGRLLSAAVVKERSNADYELCQLALESLTRAAPFGKFPPELVHERLKFNVVISFKRK